MTAPAGAGVLNSRVVPQPISVPFVSYADYVAVEGTSDIKHEWLRGEVFAIAGGSPEHGALAAAVIGELRAGLRARPCRVYSSDVRVFIPATQLSTYPDVTVVCGKLETHPEDPGAITNPVLLVEVLSDSTEAYDRGQKFAHYRRLSSLKEYVLVSQREQRIELFRRSEAGSWTLHEASTGGRIELESVGHALSVDEIYRDPLAAG